MGITGVENETLQIHLNLRLKLPYRSYYNKALCISLILIYIQNATDQKSVSVKLANVADCVTMFKQNNALKIIRSV